MDFPQVVCFNDKKLSAGELAHLSVRPEKIHITREEPLPSSLQNSMQGIVDDVVYKGEFTYYGVLVGGHKISVIRQHSRFHLDEKPIQWKEQVWISWHADDGYILARL